MALKLHPDKNSDKKEAVANFQMLQRVYAILSDPAKRKAYDQTGSLEDSESLSGEQFESLYQYYRNIYKKVSDQDIEETELQYRGSDEEEQDLLKYYTQYEGNMDKVFDWVICSDTKKDSHRFMDLVERAISQKKVKDFKKFAQWARKTKQKPRPKNPLAVKAKRKGQGSDAAGDETALIAAIRDRTGMNGILALEAKYGAKNSAENAEPTEEEFEAAAARLLGRQTGSKGEKENTAVKTRPKKKKQRRD